MSSKVILAMRCMSRRKQLLIFCVCRLLQDGIQRVSPSQFFRSYPIGKENRFLKEPEVNYIFSNFDFCASNSFSDRYPFSFNSASLASSSAIPVCDTGCSWGSAFWDSGVSFMSRIIEKMSLILTTSLIRFSYLALSPELLVFNVRMSSSTL